jgi:hypothetical protein
LKVLSLADSLPTLTAYANDAGFDKVFAEPLIRGALEHRDEADAVAMLRFTGAEGVMLGRSTRGRPDRPRTALELLRNGTFRGMCRDDLKRTVREHAALECEQFGEERGIRRMRKHIHWYLKAGGSPGADDSGQVPALGSVVINELLAKRYREKEDLIGPEILRESHGDSIPRPGWIRQGAATLRRRMIAVPGHQISHTRLKPRVVQEV